MPAFSVDWLGSSIADGRYQIERQLGEGGMGTVYKAFDNRLEADVVIKVPRPSMLEDPEFSKRFAGEIRSMVKLQHPHVVNVIDVGEHEGIPIAVLQYLSGGDLSDRQGKDEHDQLNPMPPASLKDWLPGIASALDYVHKQGYIHRDVKPANILFDAMGNAFLSDFGIAKLVASSTEPAEKLTGTGMVMGTPEYMAPELIMGHECDGRVDQYALAVAAHEALCGRVPFSGATPAAILVNQTTRDAVPLHELYSTIPEAVSNAIMKGIAKNPDERYETCSAFANAVCEAIEGQEFTVTPVSAEEIAQKETERNQGPTQSTAQPPKRRKRSIWSGPAVWTLLLIMVTLGFGVWSYVSIQSGIEAGETLETLLPQTWQVWVAVAGAVSATVLNLLTTLRKRINWTLWFGRLARVTAVFAIIAAEFGAVYGLWASIDMPQKSSMTENQRLAAIPMAKSDPSRDFQSPMGVRMVYVHPGQFTGADGETQFVSEPYWIAETEVTVAQYLAFLEETRGSDYGTTRHDPDWFSAAPKDSFSSNGHPITGVDAGDARAFCRWLNQKSAGNVEYRLPTLLEWTCAYRGGTGTTYYWGESFNGIHANSNCGADGDYSERLEVVGRFPTPQHAEKHPWGLFDIAGNVWEMVADGSNLNAVGGSWKSSNEKDFAVTGKRTQVSRADDLGFRVVAVIKK